MVDRPRRFPRPLVALAALSALGAALVVGLVTAAGDDAHITAAALLEEIDAGRAPLVLDVRSTREYASGHVPGAVHVPFAEVADRADALEGPRDQLVVVYCELGPRAGVAKLALESQGFTNVHYLEGHMSDWRSAGRPLDR